MKLKPLPKVTPTERAVAALEKQRDALDLLIKELRATVETYAGEVEPLVDPRTGEIFTTRRRRRAKGH